MRGVLGSVTGAQQGQATDPARGAGVGVHLLLDDEPPAAEPLGTQAQTPAELEASADLADGGVDELVVVGVAEPALELTADRRRPRSTRGDPRGSSARRRTSGANAVASIAKSWPARPSRNVPAAANCCSPVAWRWSVGMPPLYARGAGAPRAGARSFGQPTGSPEAETSPAFIAKRAASVRLPHTELGVDVLEVRRHGLAGDRQVVGDLRVRAATSQRRRAPRPRAASARRAARRGGARGARPRAAPR